MSNEQAKLLGNTLWAIANQLRGSMDADQFRDYMLGFIFFKYLSDKYKKVTDELLEGDTRSLYDYYETDENNKPLYAEVISQLENEIKDRIGYVLKPQYMWDHFVKFSKEQRNPIQPKKTGEEESTIMSDLRNAFNYIETSTIGQDSAEDIGGLFSEIEFNSQKLGTTTADKAKMLYSIILKIEEGLSEHNINADELGDAYEYLIAQFASNSGKKAGEFYTPQRVSTILAKIVTLDSADPTKGKRHHIAKVYDPTCGSGSLLFNVYQEMNKNIGEIHGQEKNLTTYNLARMNLLLHHIPYSKFHIQHGDTLTNNKLEKLENNRIRFDAIVANPPFSLRWEPSSLDSDDRFRGYSLPPKSSADFAFVLHMIHYLADDGTLAVVVPHGVLFRGAAEGQIRQSIINNEYLDAVIGLPANLFYSTGIPVCILVFKKCTRHKNVLFIDASKEFVKDKKQNILTEEHIDKIIDTYQYRKEIEKYSRIVELAEIESNDFNLNIPRYIDTSEAEEIIDISQVVTKYKQLKAEEKEIDEKLAIMCQALGTEFYLW